MDRWPEKRNLLPRPRPGSIPAMAVAGDLVVPDLRDCEAPSRAGGGNAGRVSWSRPKWRSYALRDARSLLQGPLPLPLRHAAPCPAGGQSPQPCAHPALGVRFAPAGPGAGLLLVRVVWVLVEALRPGGETRCVSCSRPKRKPPFRRISMISLSGRRRACFCSTLSGTAPARVVATGTGRARSRGPQGSDHRWGQRRGASGPNPCHGSG